MPKDEGYGSKIKKLLFKPRPGEIAAKANPKQKGMSAAQKKKVNDFRKSFTGESRKKKK